MQSGFTYRLMSIVIYPIKSLGGIEMTEAFACKAGLRHDRRWMLVDENCQFVSQRTHAQMALFTLAQEDDFFQVSYAGDSIKFHIQEEEGGAFETRIWDDQALSVEVRKDASQWFSEKLQKKVRLVKLRHEEARIHSSSLLHKDIPVSLADAYPYLVTGTQSLELLNEKLSVPVPMNRFRPNLVISTQDGHEEDEWGTYAIGAARFRSLKPCGRCQVVTIDQQTAQVNPETLTVLNSYRRKDQSVMFGAHVICVQEGDLKIGNSVIFDR